MSDLVRCKACGYIMEASKLGDVCPACGVPAKQFEPYDDRVKPERRRLLELHIHPVIVHAPQAFALTLVVLPLLALLVAGELRGLLVATSRVLGAALPLTVLAAFLSGLFDAKLRFRKTTTPILRTKKLLGLLFFVLSLGVCALALWSPLSSSLELGLLALVSALGLGAGAVLGIIGTPLVVAKFPG
jgi:rubredoxin